MEQYRQGLNILHDCQVLNIYSGFKAYSGSFFEIIIKCPPDLGYEEWDGKTISIKFKKISMMKWMLWDMEEDNIDAINDFISSKELLSLIARGEESGMRFPSINMTIRFTSGSSVELSCMSLQVTIPDPDLL